MDKILIYTRRLAYALRARGFEILATVPDTNKPYFDNYIFQDTEELRAAIKEIIAITKQ